MENTHLPQQLVKKRELSRILSTSPRTIDSWLAKGIIPYLAVSPRLHLFNVQQVQEALARRFGVRTKEER
jgi:hypothetical protein